MSSRFRDRSGNPLLDALIDRFAEADIDLPGTIPGAGMETTPVARLAEPDKAWNSCDFATDAFMQACCEAGLDAFSSKPDSVFDARPRADSYGYTDRPFLNFSASRHVLCLVHTLDGDTFAIDWTASVYYGGEAALPVVMKRMSDGTYLRNW